VVQQRTAQDRMGRFLAAAGSDLAKKSPAMFNATNLFDLFDLFCK
jgi:hypothetical protein